MSQEEQDQIEGKALLRRHKADKQMQVHLAKLEDGIEKIQLLIKAWEKGDLRVVNFGGRTRLCEGMHTPIDHPSEEDLIAALQGYAAAKSEKTNAEITCRNLRLIDG